MVSITCCNPKSKICIRAIRAAALLKHLDVNANAPCCCLCTQGYRDDAGIVLESDTDEQLLIQIPFQQGALSNATCRGRGNMSQSMLSVMQMVRAHES